MATNSEIKHFPEVSSFVRGITVEQVADVVPFLLIGDRVKAPTDEEQQLIRQRLNLGIDHRATQGVLPSKFSLSGMEGVVSDLSSSAFWNVLLPRSTTEAYQKIARELGREGHPAESPAHELAVTNGEFMNTALTLGILAAATGPGISRCLTPRSTRLNRGFAQAIGESYAGPADDIDDYMGRVLTLIPNPTETPNPHREGTLLYNLIKHGAFKGAKTGNNCPAPRLTGMILSEWGNLLHNNNGYQQLFKSRVSTRYI